jgi:hypothetical protein
MKTIALTAAALLVAAGSAFAGSDNFQAPQNGQNAVSVDSTYTSSVKSHVSTSQQAADTAVQDHRAQWGD